ncbi:hypothetical protein Agabi119p4_9249 [Agaricus bisporus var. burnettii]|uniref:Uncharacterized protein n=1 Tax=Agaricus bisporus var. burnettii TaxID=192524 RepID=A0A8H7EY04_AGABI|nr:hypothetical protein Agabi119p4_9249 [Agaricus bisporus var. burnettii]
MRRGLGEKARAPQSSKARQWVEVRDWWSHSVLLTNACTNKPPGGKAHPQASGGLTFLVGIDQPQKSRRPFDHHTNHRGRSLLGTSDGSSEEVAIAGLAYGSCTSSSLFKSPGVVDWIKRRMTRRYTSSRHCNRSIFNKV